MKTNASSVHTTERISAAEAVAGVRSALDAASDYSDRLPGTRMRLRVQAAMADGSFRVQIDGKPAYMRLPANVRPGATLELELVGTSPRPTFALRGIAPDAGTPSLSTTARLLAGIPGSALAPGGTAAAQAIAPLITGSPTDARTLGNALKRALALSGVFYESHLAQWMAGRRSNDDVALEPQARLARPRAETVAPNEAVRSMQTTGVSSGPSGPAQAIHPDALPVVQQQLLALDTGHVMWRGQVWKGQTLEWEIARERNPKPGENLHSSWQTRLRITLPRLGRIAATIALTPTGVHVRVGAADAATADLLGADVASLAQCLDDSLPRVSRVEVVHADE